MAASQKTIIIIQPYSPININININLNLRTYPLAPRSSPRTRRDPSLSLPRTYEPTTLLFNTNAPSIDVLSSYSPSSLILVLHSLHSSLPPSSSSLTPLLSSLCLPLFSLQFLSRLFLRHCPRSAHDPTSPPDDDPKLPPPHLLSSIRSPPTNTTGRNRVDHDDRRDDARSEAPSHGNLSPAPTAETSYDERRRVPVDRGEPRRDHPINDLPINDERAATRFTPREPLRKSQDRTSCLPAEADPMDVSSTKNPQR